MEKMRERRLTMDGSAWRSAIESLLLAARCRCCFLILLIDHIFLLTQTDAIL
jgi:hypothetical protein